jgi:hypothetical protein
MKYTAPNIFHGLDFWRAKLTGQFLTPWLIHGGSAKQEREKSHGAALEWFGGVGESFILISFAMTQGFCAILTSSQHSDNNANVLVKCQSSDAAPLESANPIKRTK